MRTCALLLSLIAAFAAPSLALAGVSVALKAGPSSHGASVTLGDLFDDAGAAAPVVVARAAPTGLDTILDAGQVQITARRAGLDWDNVTGFHRIAVASLPGEGGTPTGAKSSKKGVRHGHADQALTYARNVMAGDILSADDLVWTDGMVAPADGVSDPDAAIGKAARHALRAGAAAARHDLTFPRVIKRDDLVAVTFADDGVSLTLQAKAMGDAAVGDTLMVVNPQSKKVLEAICSGPDQAVIGPAADAMRAESFQPSGRLQTASLR